MQERIYQCFVLFHNCKILLTTNMMHNDEYDYQQHYRQSKRMIDQVILYYFQPLCSHGENDYNLSYIQMERPDHPHQAAVHLMKALRCCGDCYEIPESEMLDIQELQYRKEMLAEELNAMNYKSDSILKLKGQIGELEGLILELRRENETAQQIGISQIDRMSTERGRFESEQREGILVEITAQKNLTHQLNLQMESLLQRIKYLNRINNELIYNFCSP